MWAYICPELLKAIEAEPETSLVSEHLNSMARCIEILGRGCLNEQAMADLVKIMISTMTEHFERQAERNKKRSDEDYDEGKFWLENSGSGSSLFVTYQKNAHGVPAHGTA